MRSRAYRGLVARAGPFDGEPSEEQRTSAWLALKLLSKTDAEIVPLADLRALLSGRSGYSDADLRTAYDRGLQDGARRAPRAAPSDVAAARAQGFEEGVAFASKSAKASVSDAATEVFEALEKMNIRGRLSYRIIVSRFEGTCRLCSDTFPSGALILYAQDAPVICFSCALRAKLVIRPEP